MVFFTCQHCGESLKKTAVEKHYNNKCFNHPFVTCVDCLKDFKGNEYKQHTECVSELERYSAKGFVPKVPNDKQKVKQLQWIDMVQEVLKTENLIPPQRKLLKMCSNYNNIPRKRAKFINFIKNLDHGRTDAKIVDSVFEVLQTKFKQNVEHNKTGSNGLSNMEDDVEGKTPHFCDVNGKKENGGTSEKYLTEFNTVDFDNEKENEEKEDRKPEKKQKKTKENDIEIKMDKMSLIGNEGMMSTSSPVKKRKKRDDNENDNVSECEKIKKKLKKVQPVGVVGTEDLQTELKLENQVCEDPNTPLKRFSWSDNILRILQAKTEKEMLLKRLCKKVIAKYEPYKKEHETYEVLSAKFYKKLNRTAGVCVLEDRAKLV